MRSRGKNLKFLTYTINGRCIFVDNFKKTLEVEHFPDLITKIIVPQTATKLYIDQYAIDIKNLKKTKLCLNIL
jgi:hypothetical protein